MNLLAFDTSTDTLSIAVARGAARWQYSGPGGAQASSSLLPTIGQLLAEANLALGNLDAIAFARGPGSFTALRTACAVAQGLAFGAGGGRSVPVLPIDTLAAVAEAARQQYGCTNVIAVLDARMNEVYWARYQWQGGIWLGCGSGEEGGKEGCKEGGESSNGDFGLCAPEALVVPPGWSVVGNAQAAYGARLAPDAAHLHALPDASALLRLAPALLAAGGAVPAAQALPRYIRNKVAKTTQERADERAACA
ncbi:MAG: tRNA (adenosine(37)-N6)-threonylcarbamoyltransferase complex dimerization subunit type 1 TsaB [Burkholderiaceae bacterium]|nr:tRNA (adenosine(37)-N6)-threonylcarbamoyltransferase complex dimerization subunit type 1 TsaB [Burkholderiaceae bacterium]